MRDSTHGPFPGGPALTCLAYHFAFWSVDHSQSRAAIVAGVTTVLIWWTGYVESRAAASTGTDLPAVLLAIPAVAAAWIGKGPEESRVFGATSIAGQISLLVTAVVSILASMLFMDAAGIATRSFSTILTDRISVLGINNTAWSIVVAISVVNCFVALYIYQSRIWEYYSLATRDEPTLLVRD
jgi:hypothetical protein